MVKTDYGILVGKTTITNLDFTVSIVHFTETLEVQVHALDILNTESDPLGHKVSWIKTKIQLFAALLG